MGVPPHIRQFAFEHPHVPPHSTAQERSGGREQEESLSYTGPICHRPAIHTHLLVLIASPPPRPPNARATRENTVAAVNFVLDFPTRPPVKPSSPV